MNIREKTEQLGKNSIELKIGEKENYSLGQTRFGGKPDVPPDFVWPTYTGEGYQNIVKSRPLAFLAQFNCADLARYDKENLLPNRGLLSFFYEMDSQRWGFDPKDKGCARVYWFEDVSALSAADFPPDLEEDFRFPMLKTEFLQKTSYPCWLDFFRDTRPNEEQDKAFCEAYGELYGEEPEECSKLLGWPDVIQNRMFEQCELASQGYYLGTPEGWNSIPKEVCKQAEENAENRWVLLFQLDTVEDEDFELMFGDCGRIYFYVPKEDLAARKFDRVWLISQCY